MQEQPAIISADAAYNTREIVSSTGNEGDQEQYPGQQEIPETSETREAIWFDLELYKKRNAVERFFSWIKAFKKIVPRYERHERSFPGTDPPSMHRHDRENIGMTSLSKPDECLSNNTLRDL